MKGFNGLIIYTIAFIALSTSLAYNIKQDKEIKRFERTNTINRINYELAIKANNAWKFSNIRFNNALDKSDAVKAQAINDALFVIQATSELDSISKIISTSDKPEYEYAVKMSAFNARYEYIYNEVKKY
jgi:hypothetical protein|nr:MAG TPA: hypothetical protein [Crassvirales sp.]